jgi:hypothetical protein
VAIAHDTVDSAIEFIRRVAVAGGDVQHALAGPHVGRFVEELADDLKRRADDRVIAGAPHGLLPELHGGRIVCFHRTAARNNARHGGSFRKEPFTPNGVETAGCGSRRPGHAPGRVD